MRKTKELIVETALRLFSQKGFEAVSVRDISGELELTAPALYVHFKSKQDILDEILRRMEANDASISIGDGVPQEPYESNPASYRNVNFDNLVKFTLDMFRYWTEDAFASQFRHLLTIEQYRDKRFQQLFQQYLGTGVLQYLEDIMRENATGDPKFLAESFFSLFHLFLNQYDAMPTRTEKSLLQKHLEWHLQHFVTTLQRLHSSGEGTA